MTDQTRATEKAKAKEEEEEEEVPGRDGKRRERVGMNLELPSLRTFVTARRDHSPKCNKNVDVCRIDTFACGAVGHNRHKKFYGTYLMRQSCARRGSAPTGDFRHV